jgi:hypothetical protein
LRSGIQPTGENFAPGLDFGELIEGTCLRSGLA